MPAPADFVWPNGWKFALSIVVNVEEGAEQNIRDGDKGPEPVDELSVEPKRPMRMHGNESNYQYGIKAGAPCTLTLLDEHQIRATRSAAALALPRHLPSSRSSQHRRTADHQEYDERCVWTGALSAD